MVMKRIKDYFRSKRIKKLLNEGSYPEVIKLIRNHEIKTGVTTGELAELAQTRLMFIYSKAFSEASHWIKSGEQVDKGFALLRYIAESLIKEPEIFKIDPKLMDQILGEIKDEIDKNTSITKGDIKILMEKYLQRAREIFGDEAAISGMEILITSSLMFCTQENE